MEDILLVVPIGNDQVTVPVVEGNLVRLFMPRLIHRGGVGLQISVPNHQQRVVVTAVHDGRFPSLTTDAVITIPGVHIRHLRKQLSHKPPAVGQSSGRGAAQKDDRQKHKQAFHGKNSFG